MGARGRGATPLNGNGHQRVEPPSWLDDEQVALFNLLVLQTGEGHFVQSDAELLAGYVTACCLARRAYAEGNITLWEKAARQMAALATKLRLCPSTRLKAERVGSMSAASNLSAYDIMAAMG